IERGHRRDGMMVGILAGRFVGVRGFGERDETLVAVEAAQEEISRYGNQICAEGSSRSFESRAFFDQSHENLLRDIFRDCGAPGHMQREAVNRALMLAV